MATPGNSFGAHNCHLLLFRKLDQSVQILLELRRLHVIGIAPEAGVLPRGIDGIWTGMPKAAQSRHVPVVKPSGMQAGRQLVPVELRIVSRTWDRAHIDEPFDLVCFEETDELGHRTRRVPYRHYNHGFRWYAVFHATPGVTSPEQ